MLHQASSEALADPFSLPGKCSFRFVLIPPRASFYCCARGEFSSRQVCTFPSSFIRKSWRAPVCCLGKLSFRLAHSFGCLLDAVPHCHFHARKEFQYVPMPPPNCSHCECSVPFPALLGLVPSFPISFSCFNISHYIYISLSLSLFTCLSISLSLLSI